MSGSKHLILLKREVKSSKISLRNISLTEKLVLYFLLIGIGAISIIGVYAYYSTRNSLINRTFDQLTSLRQAKKNQVEIFFSDRIRDMILLAKAEETGEFISRINTGERKINDSERKILLTDYSDYLREYITLKSHFSSVFLFGSGNSCLMGFFPDAGNPEFREKEDLKKKILSMTPVMFQEVPLIVSDMKSESSSEKPVQYIAIAVKSKMKEVTGWLIMGISADAINRIMIDNNPKNGMGISGETYLVGKDYKLRSCSRFIPNSILKTTVRTQPVKEALTGQEGLLITRDYRHIPVLSSFSILSIPGLDWVILAEIDVKEAMIPIFGMRNNLIILSLLTSVILFAFVFFTSKRITKPIIQLQNAATLIGKGQYDVEIPVRTNDEIGALTKAFNKMSLQVRDKTRELESERTGRLRSVIDAEEAERQRLSREIHDGIGQSLIALKLRLEGLLYIDGPEIKQNIQVLKDQFDGTVDEIRRISNNLMPSVLEVFGIIIALRNLCNETEEHVGIKIHFETSGDFENINTKIKTYLFRIAQEAFNNIIKHSGAKKATLRLVRMDNQLTVSIHDNGKGFDVDSVAFERGNGLYNLRERVALLEGTIEIKSEPGKGTQINIGIPVF